MWRVDSGCTLIAPNLPRHGTVWQTKAKRCLLPHWIVGQVMLVEVSTGAFLFRFKCA